MFKSNFTLQFVDETMCGENRVSNDFVTLRVEVQSVNEPNQHQAVMKTDSVVTSFSLSTLKCAEDVLI